MGIYALLLLLRKNMAGTINRKISLNIMVNRNIHYEEDTNKQISIYLETANIS